jgi:hypothetical protein
VKALGVIAFLLFLPAIIRRFFKSPESPSRKVFLNEMMITAYGIFFIAGAGYMSALWHVNISGPVTLAGYLFLLFFLFQFFKILKLTNALILISIAGFFGFWVASVCWFMYLNPSFIESLILGTDKMDTLFHLSAAQMIKTYGVGTTGLDGVPTMKYHWGSHWFFAQLSSFLKISVNDVYQLCYPVIIGPLLFKSFLSFVMQLKDKFRPENENTKINLFFWIIFMAIFIGIFRGYHSGNTWAQYSTGGSGETHFMLQSESYAFSIILMFSLLSVLLDFWFNRDRLSTYHQAIFLLAFLPLFISILGFVKISTMYVICCLLGYVFIRLRLFKNKLLMASMIIIIFTSIATLILAYDSQDSHGSFSWLYFYRHFNISLPLFIILYYAWIFIFIVVYVVAEKLYKTPFLELVKLRKLFPVEVLLCLALAGFIPSMFLMILSYDALYFLEIQMWIASTMTLLYVPFFNNFKKPVLRVLLLLLIPCLLIFKVFIVNTKGYATSTIGSAIHIRHKLTQDSAMDWDSLKTLVKELEFANFSHKIAANNLLLKKAYSENAALTFLQKLKALDRLPLTEKRQTLIYINLRSLFQRADYNWSLHCHNIAFIVPAFTGMAMIDGIDVTYSDLCPACCQNFGFGYHYYSKWKNLEEIDAPTNLEYIGQRVQQKGFKNLIYYNLDTEAFEKVELVP